MTTGKSNSFLIYTLGKETFATNVSNIIKILEITDITKVPGTPKYVKGIINLRGSVLPVIDGRSKLDFPVTEFTKDSCIVVFEIESADKSEYIGMLVDSVIKVEELKQENILPPPAVGEKFEKDFLLGVYKTENSFILMLDVNKIFSGEDILELSQTKKNN